MKKRVIILVMGIAVLMALPAAVFAEGKQVVIMQSSNGKAVAKEQPAPVFGGIDLKGWSVSALQAAGADFYIYKIAPGAADMAIHSGPDSWIAYVLAGNGEMPLGDKEGKQTGSVSFSKGDYLVFEPNTMHGWKNTGKTDILILFVKASATE